jgi:hypothetical protein
VGEWVMCGVLSECVVVCGVLSGCVVVCGVLSVWWWCVDYRVGG